MVGISTRRDETTRRRGGKTTRVRARRETGTETGRDRRVRERRGHTELKRGGLRYALSLVVGAAMPCQPASHPSIQPAGQIQPPSNNNMLHLVPASPAHQAQAPRHAEDLRGRGGGQAQGTRRLADGGAPRPKPGVERAFWFGAEAKAERAEGNLEREGQLVRRVYIEISIL